MTSNTQAPRDQALLRAWYEGRWYLVLLLPLAWLFQLLTRLRRAYLSARQAPLTVPVVIVGNIALGGTGKTPLLIALAQALRAAGFKPGVISRGHGSRSGQYPFSVHADSAVQQAGDEPLLIAQRSGCPVVIDSDRSAALKHLLHNFSVDIVLSDDGLQHYKLPRTLEVVVLDGSRGLGNGWCLPAGPLRESKRRLQQVDWLVVNGAWRARHELPKNLAEQVVSMQLQAGAIQPLFPGSKEPSKEASEETGEKTAQETKVLADFARQSRVHAIAGIGNPRRFFETLTQLGIAHEAHVFNDHHPYSFDDVNFADGSPVVMTEKDAVKVRAVLADRPNEIKKRYYYLPVSAQVPAGFIEALITQLRSASQRMSRSAAA